MATANRPYAESCDQNREPILQVIQPLLSESRDVLEIGSGTGQHAVYFAEKMPHLEWYTSDTHAYHEGIKLWLQDAALDNAHTPLELDVSQSSWPTRSFDAVFSANTFHIMHWHNVEDLFTGVGSILADRGKLIIYGPFNYNGAYTSSSNARFDQWLKDRDPESGVRDFEALDALAVEAGMKLIQDFEMPANNRILYWQKT